MKTFTIFTGTYNSEKIIHRVFKSIENQTIKDFQWLIIDDCSKDNTVGIIEDFKSKHPELDITLHKHQVNTGVAVSRKEAVGLAAGKYFVTWDHDDEQSFNQLETYLKLWKLHDHDKIANIFAKMTDQHGKILGRMFPSEGYLSDYISVHNKYLVGHKDAGNVVEHHVCVKTERYREVLAYYESHSELLNGRFPNGGDVWGMIAYLGYKTIYSNVPVRTYYINEQGRSSMSSVKRKDAADRIFRNKLLWVNLFDTRLSANETPKKIRNVFAVVLYGLLAKKTLGDIQAEIRQSSKKVISLMLYLPASVLAKKFSRQ